MAREKKERGWTFMEEINWDEEGDAGAWPPCVSCEGSGESQGDSIHPCRRCGGSGLDPHPETPGLNRAAEDNFRGLPDWTEVRIANGRLEWSP